ncbi:hypothetical protein Cni_G07898 [Canna indica]|uniref:PUM-HD domain-containing protein n=1 Tax=Canna indica TaxID=4628 RepID=A0AAQ3JZV4_9LILI|nr:hypothetical protein Cni_G07898 [Canna indica]
MDPGKIDQEYTALDKVLVGIPNDTIGNPCASETIQSSVLPSFEPTSAHELNKSSASTNLCGLFNTEAVKVCDSNPLDNILPKTLFDQDDNSYNYHRALPMSVSQDASESPNNQSLALSFMNLGLKDRFAVMQSELDLLYQKDYSPFITENKSCEPNRHTRVTDEHDYDYGKLMELNFCDPRSISGDHKEQWQSFPNYPATMPINPWMHTCFPPTGVSEQESEFPSSSFRQQYYMESPYHANMPHQQQNRFNMLQCEMKDDRNYRRRPEQHCLKNLEHQCPEGHIRRRINSGTGQFSGNAMQSFFHVPIPHQAEQESLRSYENANVDNNRHNQLHPSFVSSNHARCHPNGFSGQCKSMLLAQAQSLPPACGLYGHSIGSHGNQVLDRFGKQTFPEKVLTRSHGLTSLRISESGSLGNRRLPEHANNTRRITPNSNVHNHLVQYDESLDLDVGRSVGSYSYSPDKNHYQLAKDQRYWHSLQSIIDKGNREDFDNVFLEIIGHAVEATTDPSGNYLVQKLVAVCTEEQKMQLISKISQSSSELLRISCNQHGNFLKLQLRTALS